MLASVRPHQVPLPIEPTWTATIGLAAFAGAAGVALFVAYAHWIGHPVNQESSDVLTAAAFFALLALPAALVVHLRVVTPALVAAALIAYGTAAEPHPSFGDRLLASVRLLAPLWVLLVVLVAAVEHRIRYDHADVGSLAALDGTPGALVGAVLAGTGAAIVRSWYAERRGYDVLSSEGPLHYLIVLVFFALAALPTGLFLRLRLVSPLLLAGVELVDWYRSVSNQAENPFAPLVGLIAPALILLMALLAGIEYWLRHGALG